MSESNPGQRQTRTTSLDERLYTAEDLDRLLKRKPKPILENEDERFFTPTKQSPKTLRSPPDQRPQQAGPSRQAPEEQSTPTNTNYTNSSGNRAPTDPSPTHTGETQIQNQNNMSTISYKDIKDLIPKYDGDRKGLDEFVTIIDALASQLTEDKDKKLLNLSIKSHLRDKAFSTIRHLINPTWEQIKQTLKDKLNPLDATTCYNALTHAKQRTNESVTEYAIRVGTLLTNLNRSSTIDANEITQKYVQDSNEMLAKRAFEHGIMNFQLKTLIIAKNKKSLDEAIREALDMDSSGEYHNREASSTTKKFCNFCKKRNHTETECFKKKNTGKVSTATPSGPSDSPKKEGKFCKYCKKPGHLIQECRARERNNAQKTSETRTKIIKEGNEELVTLEELEDDLN